MLQFSEQLKKLLEIVELRQSSYSAFEVSADAAVKSSLFAAFHVTASNNVFDVTGTLGMGLSSSLLDFLADLSYPKSSVRFGFSNVGLLSTEYFEQTMSHGPAVHSLFPFITRRRFLTHSFVLSEFSFKLGKVCQVNGGAHGESFCILSLC